MTEIHPKPEIPCSSTIVRAIGSMDAAASSSDLQFGPGSHTRESGRVSRDSRVPRAHDPLTIGIMAAQPRVSRSDLHSAANENYSGGVTLSSSLSTHTSDFEVHSESELGPPTSTEHCAPVFPKPHQSCVVGSGPPLEESAADRPDTQVCVVESPSLVLPEEEDEGEASPPPRMRVTITSASIRRAPSIKLSLDSQAPRRNSTECIMARHRHRMSFAELLPGSCSQSLTRRVAGASSTPDVSAADRDRDSDTSSQGTPSGQLSGSRVPTPTLRVTRASMRRRSRRCSGGRTTLGHTGDGGRSPGPGHTAGGERTVFEHSGEGTNTPGHTGEGTTTLEHIGEGRSISGQPGVERNIDGNTSGYAGFERNIPGRSASEGNTPGHTTGSGRNRSGRSGSERGPGGQCGGHIEGKSPGAAQHRWKDLAEVMRRYRDESQTGDRGAVRQLAGGGGSGGGEVGGSKQLEAKEEKKRKKKKEEEEEQDRLVNIVFSNVCYLLPVKADVPRQEEHLFDVSDLQHEPPLISKCGSLEVTFTFDSSKAKMAVHIHRAREIPAKDRGGANNTQVRVMLLPTKKQRFKTKVKEGQDPAYDESFIFSKVTQDEVPGMGLRFRLYGLERMRRERMIGESVIGFASLNLVEPSTHWVILEPRSNLSHGDSGFDVSSLSRSDSASSTQSLQHGGMPELLVGLAYNGTTGRLAVQVIKGSNFRNMAMNRAPDTYVKVTLMSPTGQELQRCKTSVRRGQPNPLFKETFMLQVALFQLPDVTLMVSVYNKKSMKKKEMIGWFSLGQNSSGEEESSHWTDMRESKGEEVCRWHVLLES